MRIGVDTGGTFTDVVAARDDGTLVVWKGAGAALAAGAWLGDD